MLLSGSWCPFPAVESGWYQAWLVMQGAKAMPTAQQLA